MQRPGLSRPMTSSLFRLRQRSRGSREALKLTDQALGQVPAAPRFCCGELTGRLTGQARRPRASLRETAPLPLSSRSAVLLPVAALSTGSAHTRRPDFYPLTAVFRSALVSFCAQRLAAPTTGSALPGNVSQPLFTSMSPR
jgi:hypothetical protein